MPVSPIPAGFHTATPYLIVRDAPRAIDFYKQAFGATEVLRLTGPGGSIGHAEIKIGDSVIMLAEEMPGMGIQGPESLGGSPVSILLYYEDADAAFDRAVAMGATVKRPVADQFYGDRSGTLRDPFGHTWSLATHKEDLPQEEVQRRFDALHAAATSGAA